MEIRAPPSPAPDSLHIKTPDSSPDVFAEFALTEEQMTPVSPIRRRRPSDAGMPRSKTNKELTNEIERLKDILMESKMRVELLRKDQSKLQHELTRAKERVEALEPLEQENMDLQAENEHMRLQVDAMEDEIARLKDDNEEVLDLRRTNEELHKTNEELTAIASESTDHMDRQEAALDEAVEYIVKMEAEKTQLTDELKQLKERIVALENASPTSTLVDGSVRYPSRVYSVDESRPSTSHFDSDYYSQPDSPQVKPSGDSIISITPSERSKKFLDLSEERRRSARDLVKRMSIASLRALSVRSPSPRPEVPQIPQEFRNPTPRLIEGDRLNTTPRTPGRYRKGRQAVPQSLVDEALYSPTRRGSLPRQAPTAHPDGLRGLYRPERPARSKTTHDIDLSSSRDLTPTNVTSLSLGDHQNPRGDTSPSVPSRGSSKHAHTSSSSEHLQRRKPRHRRQSESDMRSSGDAPGTKAESVTSEWDSSAPPPPRIASVISESDLTTELDPEEYRDKHWRDLDRLTLSQVLDQQRLNAQRTNRGLELTPDRGGYRERSTHDSSRKKDSQQSSSYDSLRRHVENQERQSKTTPGTPYLEKNFLFNHEDDETFLQKTRSKFGPRRP